MEESLGILTRIVVANVVILIVVVLVIRKLLLSDTVKAVARIGDAETELRRKEEDMRREMQQNEQEVVAKKKEAEDELESRRADSERDVVHMKEQVLEDARGEAAEILEKARKNERKMREQVVLEMDEKAVEFGGQVFKLVFSERLTEGLNKQFIDELLDALEETDADGITVEADDAQFTSSHPLAIEQRQRLQKILAEKLGVSLEINESVREELLAGLVMKLGSLEIDGSLLSRYQEAVSELKKQA